MTQRELSLSNYSSCCCWTLPLLSDCYCLILKSTDSASDMGLAVWKPKPHCKVWRFVVSEACCRPARETAGCEHTKFPQGKVGAAGVTRGLCDSPPEPSLLLFWAHLSSSFPCPGSLSCSELQPAGKHTLQGASFQMGQPCLDTRSAAGPGQEPLAGWVCTGWVCTGTVSSALPGAMGDWHSWWAQGAALQCSNAAQLPQQHRAESHRDQWRNAAPRGFRLPVHLKNTAC